MHNHPSGEVKPSSADIKMTKEVKDCLKLFDVVLVDHIILSEKKYYSFTDESGSFDCCDFDIAIVGRLYYRAENFKRIYGINQLLGSFFHFAFWRSVWLYRNVDRSAVVCGDL